MKLCTECKWSVDVTGDGDDFIRCGKTVNLSNGKPKLCCYVHREHDVGWLKARVFDLCGREGRWWEPKHDTYRNVELQ